MMNDRAMPVFPALAVRPMRWVYDVEEVGRSKLSTQLTFLKSIPRETPYSLSFLRFFLFLGSGSVVLYSAVTSEGLFFGSEDPASSSLPASDWISTSSPDGYSLWDSVLVFGARLLIFSPIASCSSDAMMISYMFLLNSSTT